MPVTLVLRGKTYEMRANMALREALLKLDIIPETVLATRRGELITDDVVLREGDIVKLIAVISGGSDEV